MNDDELLPKDEPGAPLLQVNPGFADKVMGRIEKHDRQQKRVGRGMALFVALAVAVVIGAISSEMAKWTPSNEAIPGPQRAYVPLPPPPQATVPHLEPSPGGGVVVRSLEKGNRLANAGVRRGDVVKSIDHHPVNDAALAAALLRAADNCKEVQFVVVRDSRERTVTSPPQNAAPCRSPFVRPR
jgi:S1-C subfamily serine protease